MTYRHANSSFSREQRKAIWLGAYEAELVARVPSQAGKIDWDTATYLFNSGIPFEQAAKQVAERLNQQS